MPAKSMTMSSESGRAKCSSWSLSQSLIVTLWDNRTGVYLQFPQTQRIHSWTSIMVSLHQIYLSNMPLKNQLMTTLSSQIYSIDLRACSDRNLAKSQAKQSKVGVSNCHLYVFEIVQELKTKITEELGYPASQQRLYLHNQELEDGLEVKDLVT